jgi:hypothetical protein
LELSGAHQLLVYAEGINFLDDNINNKKESKVTLLGFSEDVGLEINAEKTKYMIISRHPNSGQNQNIRIAEELFENVAKFKYLGTALINQNDINGEFESRLHSGSACYNSVQNILSSRLIQKTKNLYTQNSNFASRVVWVRSLVSHFEEGRQS